MQNGYLTRRAPSTDKLGASAHLAPAAFPPRFASVASRCSCNKSQEERPFPALPFRPRDRPELERDAAEDETEQREDREVERRHDDRECERKRREHGGAASVFELGEGSQ